MKHIFNSTNSTKTIAVVLLVINLILSVYVAFFKRDALWLETLKAGGSENFAMVEKLYTSDTYKNQQAQTLAQVLGSMEGASATTETTDAKTLDQATMEKLFKDTYTKGKQDARFVILEYSDLLCPFCKRHYEAQTLEKIVEKYPNDVALIFKNMPLVQLHPTAFVGAEWVECAGMVGWVDKFYTYLDKAFKEQSFDETNIATIAKGLGINSKKFTTCVTSHQFKSKIDGIIQEAGSIFGINGTPGNVILDRQTGKYTIINGAYPFEEFDTKLQAMMQ